MAEDNPTIRNIEKTSAYFSLLQNQEIWASHIDFHGYEISSLGKVRRVLRAPGARVGKILKYQKNMHGYLAVSLSQDGYVYQWQVHRLVAYVFLGFPYEREVNHVDGDKNNQVSSNWSILCPNCHSFTDSYKGKNIGRYKKD